MGEKKTKVLFEENKTGMEYRYKERDGDYLFFRPKLDHSYKRFRGKRHRQLPSYGNRTTIKPTLTFHKLDIEKINKLCEKENKSVAELCEDFLKGKFRRIR